MCGRYARAGDCVHGLVGAVNSRKMSAQGEEVIIQEKTEAQPGESRTPGRELRSQDLSFLLTMDLATPFISQNGEFLSQETRERASS